jgi:hypothetical protein
MPYKRAFCKYGSTKIRRRRCDKCSTKSILLRAQQSGAASSLLLPRCEGEKIITCAHLCEREEERLKKATFPLGSLFYLPSERKSESVCSDGSFVLRARVCVHCFKRGTSIATLSGNYKFNVCEADVRVPRRFHSCALCAKVIQLFLERAAPHSQLSQRAKEQKANLPRCVAYTSARKNNCELIKSTGECIFLLHA